MMRISSYCKHKQQHLTGSRFVIHIAWCAVTAVCITYRYWPLAWLGRLRPCLTQNQSCASAAVGVVP